jgi:hypothetical protein
MTVSGKIDRYSPKVETPFLRTPALRIRESPNLIKQLRHQRPQLRRPHTLSDKDLQHSALYFEDSHSRYCVVRSDEVDAEHDAGHDRHWII